MTPELLFAQWRVQALCAALGAMSAEERAAADLVSLARRIKQAVAELQPSELSVATMAPPRGPLP